VSDWSRSVSRSSPVLVCDGRFYQGYRLKSGDAGEIVFGSGQNSNLCLWKFFPQKCQISFYCSEFSVGTRSGQRTCPSKLITKIDKRNAKRWCGSQTPPRETKPLRTKKPILVGYMALKKSGLLVSQNLASPSDRFKCRIGCSRTGSIAAQAPSSVGTTLNCKCGETSRRSLKIKSRSGFSQTFISYAFSCAVNLQDLLNSSTSSFSRIVVGSAAEEGSVPWQASLAVEQALSRTGTWSLLPIAWQEWSRAPWGWWTSLSMSITQLTTRGL
jgi:hypothetical protein